MKWLHHVIHHKWLRFIIYLGFVSAAIYNLYTIEKRVLNSYERPLEERAASGKCNMDGMIALADKHITENKRKDIVLGIWYPFNDPVTKRHLNMIFSYNLYPLRAVSAEKDNLRRLDCIAGYQSHLFEFMRLLSNAGMNDKFTLIKDGSDNFLLIRPCHLESSLQKGKTSKVPHLSLASVVQLLLGLIALIPIGKILLDILFRRTGDFFGVWKWLFAWALGTLLIVLTSMSAGMLGLKLFYPAVWGTIASLAFIVCLIRYVKSKSKKEEIIREPISRIDEGKRNGVYRLFVCGMSCLVACGIIFLIFQALSRPVCHITGLGVWGLKARAFYEAGGIDFDFLKNPDLNYSHLSYPLGFPLFLAYCCSWMGSFNDWAIKIIPAMMAISIAGLLLFIFRRMGYGLFSSLLFVLLFCTGSVFFGESEFLQAETMLLLFSLTGCYFLMEYLNDSEKRRFLWCGTLFLGGAASVKQEGIFFFITAAGLTAILSGGFRFARRRKSAFTDLGVLLTVIALFILPWQIYWRWNRLPVNDFDWAIPLSRTFGQNMSLWLQALLVFLRQMFCNLSSITLIWVTGTIIVVINWKKIFRNRESLFLLISSLLMVFIFASIYIFSVYSGFRLTWHLRACERLLLFPSCLFLILECRLFLPDKEKMQ